ELSVAAQDGAKVLAIDVLHGDEADAVGLAEIKNADHVLVRDVAGEDELLFETLQDRGIGGEFGPDDFERDQAVQLTVAGLVDRAHAALPQHALDFVASTDKRSWAKTVKGGDAVGGMRRVRSRTNLMTNIRERACGPW